MKDPAVGTVATGLLVGGGGIQEALETLGAHPDDWLIRCAVITRADQLYQEQRRKEIEATAALVGNRVGEVIAKAFRA